MLAYSVPGFSFPIHEMDSEERIWYLKRIKQQKDREAEAMKSRRGKGKK